MNKVELLIARMWNPTVVGEAVNNDSLNFGTFGCIDRHTTTILLTWRTNKIDIIPLGNILRRNSPQRTLHTLNCLVVPTSTWIPLPRVGSLLTSNWFNYSLTQLWTHCEVFSQLAGIDNSRLSEHAFDHFIVIIAFKLLASADLVLVLLLSSMN